MAQDPSDNAADDNDNLDEDDSVIEVPDRALVPLPARQIEVFGDEILAVRLPNGSIWLSLRALCENFGLARAMQAQRIKRNDILAANLIDVLVETRGGGADPSGGTVGKCPLLA